MATTYSAVIDIGVQGSRQVEQLLEKTEQLRNALRSLSKLPIAIDDKRASDTFKQLAKSANDYARGLANGQRQLANTEAGLNQVAKALNNVAANSKIGGATYTNAVQAQEKAEQKLRIAQLSRLKTLKDLYGMGKMSFSESFKGIPELVALGSKLPNSVAALSAYRSELVRVLDLVEIGSNEFKAMEEAIASVDKRLEGTKLAGQKSAVTPAAGPATRLDTVTAFEKRAAFAQKISDLEYKQLVTGQQIVQAKLKETQQEDLQNRLAQASEALQRNELDLAKRLTTELRNQRIAYERANRAEEALMRPTSMVAGAAESVTGRRPGNLPPVPGSPAAIAATTRAVAVSPAAPRGTQSAVEQSINLQKRYNNLLTSAQILEQKALGYKSKGLQTEQQIAVVQNTIQNIRENGANITKQYLDALDNVLNNLRNELRLTKAVADARKAVTSGAKVPKPAGGISGSKPTTGGAGLQNALIGGAFPLLFGGGVGAVVGGFAGGFIPGNPMMSIVTSALGTVLDQFVASATEMGSSLQDPISNFQKLADAGLIASRSQQKYIEQLINAGRVTEAAAAIQEEIVNKIGAQGVKELQAAGSASGALNKQLAELSLQMQAAVAGPLTDMLTWLNTFLASVTRYNRQQAAQTDFLTALREANPEAYQQYFRESMQLREANRGVVDPAALQRLQQQYTQRFGLQPGATTSSIDKTPELQAKAQTAELQAQVTLEAKKLTLVGMSLKKNGQAYTEAAKAVALQEYENRLLEIKNSWIGQAFDLERNQAMIRLANLQYAGKLKAIDAERLKDARDELDIRRAILGLQAELIGVVMQAGDLDVQYARVTQGEAASIQEELNQLQARTELEARTLDLQLQQKLLTEDLTAQEKSLLHSIYNEQLKNLTLQASTRQKILLQAQAQLAFDKAIADAQTVQRAKQPFEDLRRNRELEIQYNKTYLRLVTEGVLPAEAERIANFERLVAEQLNALDKQIAITRAALIQAEAYGVSADKIKELRDELERLDKARGAVVDEATKGPEKEVQPGEKIEGAIAAARGELNKLVDLENQVIAGAAAIGDAFQEAFRGLVSGAMTGQEALAAFFKGVGDHFLDMASKMIAKLIEIYILETVLGFITGAAGGGSAPRGTPGAIAPNGAAYFGPAFADGGFVTGPTNALIGEGGEPEYVIPASKMRTAMGRYAAGARGNSVIPGNGGEPATAGGGAATMEPIDVRYSIERINNVDYVTADQFQRGMAQAAQQGAVQGERRALRSLKNSSATRRSVAI